MEPNDQDEMAAAIAEGVAALTSYMYDHGGRAQRVLATKRQRGVIEFGTKSGGGYHNTVFLDQYGIRSAGGSGGDYNRVTNPPERATPQQAVQAFAQYGAGWRNPEKVRNIVTWLTERIEAIEQSQ